MMCQLLPLCRHGPLFSRLAAHTGWQAWDWKCRPFVDSIRAENGDIYIFGSIYIYSLLSSTAIEESHDFALAFLLARAPTPNQRY